MYKEQILNALNELQPTEEIKIIKGKFELENILNYYDAKYLLNYMVMDSKLRKYLRGVIEETQENYSITIMQKLGEIIDILEDNSLVRVCGHDIDELQEKIAKYPPYQDLQEIVKIACSDLYQVENEI